MLLLGAEIALIIPIHSNKHTNLQLNFNEQLAKKAIELLSLTSHFVVINGWPSTHIKELIVSKPLIRNGVGLNDLPSTST
jgi:hypothetical protein